MRNARLRTLVLFAALTLLGLVPEGSASTESAASVTTNRSVPHGLLGVYSRKVTSAEVAGTAVPAGVYRLTIKQNGIATFFSKSFGAIELPFSASSPGRITFRNPECSAKGLGWKAAGRSLTLTKVRDSCVDRAAVVPGVWRRS